MIADALTGFGIVVAVAALGVWGWPWLRRTWRGTTVRAALQFSRDGRYAVRVADRLQASSSRIRRALRTLEPDAADREAMRLMLGQFTGTELTALLWQMRLILATGDNEHIRGLNRRIETATQAWSQMPAMADRQRAEADIAGMRQEMETRRRMGQAWVSLLRGMETAAQDLEALERELIVLGIARQQPLSEFRVRIADSLDGLRRLRAAHAELDQAN